MKTVAIFFILLAVIACSQQKTTLTLKEVALPNNPDATDPSLEWHIWIEDLEGQKRGNKLVISCETDIEDLCHSVGYLIGSLTGPDEFVDVFKTQARLCAGRGISVNDYDPGDP